MARQAMFAVAFVLSVVSVTVSYPDAPLYPNTIAFASAPLLRQPAQAAPQFITRPINNGAYTLSNPTSPNPTILVAAQTNQNPGALLQQRVVTSPEAASPQGTVYRIVSEGAVQSLPRNFVTFSQTPNQQVVQSPAEPVQSFPRNFVTFTTPTQQVIQPAEQVQSVPRNFITFTRSSPQQFVQPSQQQDFESRNVLAANKQPVQFAVRTPVQQFGLRNVAPVPSGEATPANALPQQSGVRTVFFFPPQQASPQTNAQADQKVKFVASPTKLRTVPVARPAQAPEQLQLSANVQNQPSSSQFFTRNFGNSGAVTYFIQPLSAPAGQVASLNQPSLGAET